MKAVVQHGFGGVEVLRFEEVANPAVGRNDVLVRIAATALNRLDLLQRQGPPLIHGFSLPHISGMDIAGTVIEVGSDVRSRVIGDRVVINPTLECGICKWCRAGEYGFCEALGIVGGTRPGGYAELCSVPADHVYPVPSSISFEEAATIPTVFSMAWHALVVAAGVRPGETVLVHGAGSSLSIAAVQIAKNRGARVIVTSRSEKKLETARQLGVDKVINLGGADFAERCREMTNGEGVDVAFDHVGEELFAQTMNALKPWGRLVFCGSTTGTRASIDLPYAYQRGIRLIGAGPTNSKDFGSILESYWNGDFQPVIDSTYPLSEAAAAQERMESGDHIGKILLLPVS